MIIRLSLGDNDFTHYLEDFANGLRNRMFNCDYYPDFKEPVRNDYENVNAYSDAIIKYLNDEKKYDAERTKLMHPDARYKKGTASYRKICSEILRLWKIYANNHGMDRFTPDISIQHSFEEGWENGEVVCYFSAYDRCIVK